MTSDQRFDRVVTDLEPVCPAGEAVAEAVGGTSCRCRITDSLISASTDPSSLRFFCMNERGGYMECPAWRADKHKTWTEAKSYDEVLEGPPAEQAA